MGCVLFPHSSRRRRRSSQTRIVTGLAMEPGIGTTGTQPLEMFLTDPRSHFSIYPGTIKIFSCIAKNTAL